MPVAGKKFGNCQIRDCQSAGLKKNNITGLCDDIDECATFLTHTCDPMYGVCTNNVITYAMVLNNIALKVTDPSWPDLTFYTCSCQTDYTGNGQVCCSDLAPVRDINR